MTAQHMVEHLILAVQMSNGKLKLECFNPPEKLPTLKRFLLSSRPLPKMFENPALGKGLQSLKYKSLYEAIEKLKEEVENYYSFFNRNPDAKTMNVTFGELNKYKWDVFHKKHFEHHLSQFNLTESK
jgi:oxepin-CoA hydrolase/3-oxo-5,6-dehydrosuberyl-CoA semialdehyde dehydrogenase